MELTTTILAFNIVYNTISCSMPLSSLPKTLLDKKTTELENNDIVVVGILSLCGILYYAAKIAIISQIMVSHEFLTFCVIILLWYGLMGGCNIYAMRHEGTKAELIAAAIGRTGFIADAVFTLWILHDIINVV